MAIKKDINTIKLIPIAIPMKRSSFECELSSICEVVSIIVVVTNYSEKIIIKYNLHSIYRELKKNSTYYR